MTGRGLGTPRATAAVVALAMAMTAGACGGNGKGDQAGIAAKDIKVIEVDVPPALLGLPVAKEDVLATVNQISGGPEDKPGEGRTYVEGNAFYSVREPDGLLEATIQVTRFTKDAPVKSGRFKRQVVQQIGGSTPQVIKVGDQSVYLTAGAKQKLFAFFKERHLFVLSVRETYPQPRNLLRKALEIEP